MSRVEAFSDGVFAIAITLLVLEFQVPQLGREASNAGLWRGLLEMWPSMAAYLGSFSAILIMWVNHHGFFRLLSGVNARFLFANGFLLLLVAFVPYPTAVLAAYLNRPGTNVAAAFYCGTYVFINIGYNLLWHTAAGPPRLFAEQAPQRVLYRVRNAYYLAFFVYLAATLIALWQAYLGLGICLSLWVLWARLKYMDTPR